MTESGAECLKKDRLIELAQKGRQHAEKHASILVAQKEKLHKQIDGITKTSVRPATAKHTGLMGTHNPLLAQVART